MKPNRNYASKLNSLTESQTEQIVGWLMRDRMTYDETRSKVKEAFGLSVSASSLSGFWKRVCEPRILAGKVSEGGKVILDVQLGGPARLRVIQIGPIAVTVLGEGASK